MERILHLVFNSTEPYHASNRAAFAKSQGLGWVFFLLQPKSKGDLEYRILPSALLAGLT